MLQALKSLLIRDLNKLREELRLYKNSSDLWVILPGTSNSGGNLALHLIGNLRHFIGNELGKSGYVRQRDEEFSRKDVSLVELDALISSCIKEITMALDGASHHILANDFPKEIGGQKHDTQYAMLHIMGHLSYHLGQINYHRRLVATISS